MVALWYPEHGTFSLHYLDTIHLMLLETIRLSIFPTLQDFDGYDFCRERGIITQEGRTPESTTTICSSGIDTFNNTCLSYLGKLFQNGGCWYVALHLTCTLHDLKCRSDNVTAVFSSCLICLKPLGYKLAALKPLGYKQSLKCLTT